MDQHRFDALARRLAPARSRRAIATAIAGAALLARAPEKPAEAAIRLCHMPGTACKNGRQCCSGACKDGACGCIAKGKSCFQIGFACCSGRCRRGRCA